MKLKKHFNGKYMELSGYVILTCIVVYILSRIADHTGVILAAAGRGISWLSAIMRPVVIGFVVAYLLYPVLVRLEKLLKKIPLFKENEKRRRRVAVAVVSVAFFVIVFIVGTFLVSAVTKQVSTANIDSIVTAIQGYASSFKQLYTSITNGLARLNMDSTQLQQAADQLGNSVGDIILNIGNSIGKSLSNAAGIATTTVFSIIFAIYFMLDAKGLKKYWGSAARALLPKSAMEGVSVFLRDLDSVFSGYIRGQMMDAVFMAVIVSVVFTIERVPYAPAIGLLTGFANLIPYMGPVVGYGTTIVVGLISGNLERTVIAIITLFVIQTIDGNVINPKFLSSSINIHPMLVLIAIIFGNKIGGLLGMVLAVPVAALVKIWFERLLSVARKEKEKKAAKILTESGGEDNDTSSSRMEEVKEEFKEAIEKGTDM